MAKRRTGTDSADAALALQSRIGYTFHNSSLLARALTHSSLAFEAHNAAPNLAHSNHQPVAHNAPSEDNEQLEFLGDAVVGLVITELLCKHFAARPEGDLTRMRAMLVSGKSLAVAGTRLALGDALQLGRGEESTGGRRKPALIANAVEALVAAIYLDAAPEGLATARTFVERELFIPRHAELEAAAQQGAKFGGVIGDWKSALQELLQARAAGQPQYVVTNEAGEGPEKQFTISVLLDDRTLGTGEGHSKKAAQQQAAERAYALLSAEASATGDPVPTATRNTPAA